MTEEGSGPLQKPGVSIGNENQGLSRKLPQYMAVLSATLGALAAGMVQGWSSPAGDNGSQLKYSFKIDANDFSWVSSTYTLGAAATCIPIGILVDLIGRRRTMLMTAFPFTIGWACVIWPNSVGILVFGRFLLGLSSGAVCVIAPIYIGEIADVNTRGRLGSYVELNFALGILLAYILCLLHSMFLLSLISAAVPLIFFATFYFMPETPTYYLMKGNVDAARKTLIWLRGSHNNVEPELDEQKNALTEAKRNKISFFVAIRSRLALKSLFIGFGLMFFQQLSGINAIIFYGSGMFEEAMDNISDWPIIVVGALQVTAVVLSTLVIDKWGRRILLFVSGAVMCINCFLLGIYFHFAPKNEVFGIFLSWLPLVCFCLFILAFEFGLGPIPWLMMGEIFPARIKGVASSSACTFNWLMAFVVTKFYFDVKNHIGIQGTFWIFSVICGLSIVFVYFAVPETKGKTLEQIQIEFDSSAYKQKQKNIVILQGDVDLLNVK